MSQQFIRTAADLRSLAEQLNRPVTEVEQDFLLVQIAVQLQEDFPDQLCFKGGFVLRHAYQAGRMSIDIDATRQHPSGHKLDADAMAASIRQAGRPHFKIPKLTAATDSARSLDFDAVKFQGPISSRGQVAVEVSYREEVVLAPVPLPVGPPYISAVIVPTMSPAEMLCEKYRTLCQRQRPTDLFDAALLLDGIAGVIDVAQVRDLVPRKFVPGVVRGGNHANRIRENVDAMQTIYAETIAARADHAPTYDVAAKLVLSKLGEVFG